MTQLEIDLREALHERAARVHASPALLKADYHPRTGGMRPRLALGGGLAAAAGGLVAALSLIGGASSAFAGWTPQPSKPTRAQLAATDTYCSEHAPFQGLPLRLVEARGPYTIAIYSDGTSDDFCSTGPGAQFDNASGWTTSPPVTVPAGQLVLWTDHVTSENGQSYGSMIAQAADDVTGANIRLDDGSVVTATVENGWAVAWWPGTAHVASAQLTTPSGTETQTFPAYPCDVHNCHGGGPHGGAPGGGPGGG
jgi:hypothetical protein